MATTVLLIGMIVSSNHAAPSSNAPAPQQEIAAARDLLQTGKYSEAVDAFEKLRSRPDAWGNAVRSKIALGLADSLASRGDYEQAIRLLVWTASFQGGEPDVWARLADLEFDRGRWIEAEAAIQRALAKNSEHLLARWIAARLDLARGKTEAGVEACKWFVDHYNARQAELDKNADSLVLIGQASEIYFRAKARGDDLAQELNNVINGIYEEAIRADSKCWKASWLEGRLFLSGYNERSAMPELQKALKINPRAAEVIVTLGQADLQGYKLAAGRKLVDRALAINPRYYPANILLADLNISDERFDDALVAAKKAVDENPKSEDALARLAASYRLLVKPIAAQVVESEVLARNPRPSDFYAALGERLSDRRKYPSAERAFLLAIKADPDRADPRIGLGMLYMQIGREEEAHDLFETAFAADPFNVRADNMLKVLRHMSSYAQVKTDHYIVTMDPKQDALLARYMAKYLESVYPELTTKFGFTPPARSVVEIMKNHEWFSGRTTGLPFIPTVGACTGKVVALASPLSVKKPYNWSRVLKHEMVHVVTLQQTNFNIPHWYTEALAVDTEGFPRPQPWNKMLLERVPARKGLLDLDTINLGFIRPKEPDDRQMAYCQAQLYAQYMLKRFGSDALIKMLNAYRRGETTDRAIVSSFGVSKADFESGYLDFLDETIKTIRARVSEEKPVSFSELERMIREKPDDADLNAKMAYEHFSRRDYREARPFADKALKIKPNHPLASYVKARLMQTIGDSEGALKILEPAFDEAKPNERVVDLLAELTMKAGDLDKAEKLYEIAHHDDPYHSKWIAGLARVHLRQKNEDKFLADLAMLADNDADDLDVRKALAERHLKRGDFDQAAKWAYECIYVDVKDPAAHVTLADADFGLKKFGDAIEEYEVGLSLKAKKPNDVKVKLARARLGLGLKSEAKATLETILKSDPDHPEAKKLLDEIEKKAGEK